MANSPHGTRRRTNKILTRSTRTRNNNLDQFRVHQRLVQAILSCLPVPTRMQLSKQAQPEEDPAKLTYEIYNSFISCRFASNVICSTFSCVFEYSFCDENCLVHCGRFSCFGAVRLRSSCVCFGVWHVFRAPFWSFHKIPVCPLYRKCRTEHGRETTWVCFSLCGVCVVRLSIREITNAFPLLICIHFC